MTTDIYRRAQKLVVALMALALFAMPFSALAQTRIVYHSNKYKPSDDVQVGRQAAAQAEQQMPVLRDEEVTAYVERVGQRLVAAIPQEFQHPEFRYYFRVINARDINAFALPGGPMYVNRGMIEAARTEGEMAGVMAHELSHVALRHGTAQATKAQKYSILAGVAGIAGAILGGPAAGQLGQAAIGAYFLKFSREYETEADVLGAQIMARANYDPRDLANMFRTIQQQGGSSGPEFLSDHPNPANRYERINQEAAMLRVDNPIRESAEFVRVQQRLRGMGRASTMAEIAQSGQRYPSDSGGGSSSSNYPTGNVGGRVAYPSSRYRAYTGGNVFRLSYPNNWRELPENNDVWFAPEGAYGSAQGTNVFTHGVNVGVAQAQSRNLRQATDAFISSLAQGNANMRQQGAYQSGIIDRRNALAINLSNVNEATGRAERVTVYTTLLRNGDLFYMITVAPQDDYRNYQTAFRTILGSIQLSD
ncbi:MAG TPA: M48 family metallopeptidase [Pyrinomonadaceae bacterium]|jgi:Zn-dependent protease with chaperone function|nr:M48 family metallopeptidase [Pyrinomonadaceae bacterium]